MWLNIHIKDKTLEGEAVEIGQRDALYFLGSNLVLRRCKVTLRIPSRRLHVIGAQFIDCDIEMKHELKNLRFEGAFFQGCRFTGRMRGLDFGHWPESKHKTGIEHCDFSGARLQYCRFFNCDMATLRLPPWPCFTLLNPTERAEELRRLPWPGMTHLLVSGGPRPPGVKAVTNHAPSYARECDASVEDLRRVLEQAGGVLF